MLIKKHAILITLMVVMLSCTSCKAGRGDWKYPLPNGYQVFMSNSSNIAIVGTEYHEVDGIMTKTYIENYIVEFCYDERYVAAIRQEPKENPSANEYSTHLSYYLLDTQTATVYGPYDIEEYEKMLNGLDDIALCKWIPTNSTPSNVSIDSSVDK